MTCCGMVWHDTLTWQDMSLHDMTWYAMTRSDIALYWVSLHITPRGIHNIMPCCYACYTTHRLIEVFVIIVRLLETRAIARMTCYPVALRVALCHTTDSVLLHGSLRRVVELLSSSLWLSNNLLSFIHTHCIIHVYNHILLTITRHENHTPPGARALPPRQPRRAARRRRLRRYLALLLVLRAPQRGERAAQTTSR